MTAGNAAGAAITAGTKASGKNGNTHSAVRFSLARGGDPRLSPRAGACAAAPEPKEKNKDLTNGQDMV